MRGPLVALMLASLLAGCGGDESAVPRQTSVTTAGTATTDPTETTARPSSSFVSQAEAICRQMQRDAAPLSSAKPTDERIAELVVSWRSSVKRLRALEPPQERRRQFEQMLAHYRNLIRAIDAMTKAEDETVLAAVAALAVEGQRGSRAARKAGLDDCALFPEIRQPPPDPQNLYDATRDLVPAGARITRDGGLDCDTSDSCLIEFELGGSVAAQVRQARAVLRAHGWKSIRSGRTPTGSRWVMANRNDYAATLEFVGEKRPEHCGGPVTYGCRDNVWVHRVEVPEVLTGG